ncbi:MAG TPA: S-layer homology domain-containing protein [Chroococcidiopsis sp.]
MSAKRSVIVSVLLMGGLWSLAGCANSPLGQTVQRSLAADPRLEESPVVLGGAAATPENTPEETATPEQKAGLGAVPAAPAASASPSPLAAAGRVLAPSTQGNNPSLVSSGGRSPRPMSSPSTGSSASGSSSPGTAGAFRDLNQAPEELRSYIEALARLGVLSVSASSGNAAGEFKPNQPVTRREFARWLVATNNRLFSDRPADKIRLGDSSDQPAFSDVPRTDPDFAAIQGLADAGLIPSALAGEPSATSFRPNAPLTREDLILWKTPLDTRQTLPTGSVDVVRQTWGFQDAARIDPRALRAVQADFGNGDLSNIRRAFGYTTLFQPKKPVTRAEAAATLWYFGYQGDGVSAQDALAN